MLFIGFAIQIVYKKNKSFWKPFYKGLNWMLFAIVIILIIWAFLYFILYFYVSSSGGPGAGH